MFYEVSFEEEEMFPIRIQDVNNVCFINWKNDETWEECLRRMDLCSGIYCTFHVWSESDKYKEDGTFFSNVYEVKCCKTNRLYYLVSYKEISDAEDMKNCVCLVHNIWNVIKFFRENLLPFDRKNFFYGLKFIECEDVECQ